MSPDEYLDAAAGRLRVDGADVSTLQMRGLTALVGYRSDFRWRWMATRLNLFTVLINVPSVTASELELFANEALDYAVSQKGKFRGLQGGVAAIPVLIGSRVDPDAATFASTRLIRRFSAFAWPAAVDLSSQRSYHHQGRVAMGGVYASWMRQQTAVALPPLIG
jgi:hypothetical protein